MKQRIITGLILAVGAITVLWHRGDNQFSVEEEYMEESGADTDYISGF